MSQAANSCLLLKKQKQDVNKEATEQLTETLTALFLGISVPVIAPFSI